MNRCMVLEPEARQHWALTVFCGMAIGALVLGIALLVSSCSSPRLPTHYQVYLSPTMSEDDMQPVLQAMASWQNMTGRAWLDANVATCPENIQPGDICIQYGAGGDLGGLTEDTNDGRAYVWLRSPVTLQAAGHELGHAQGIVHHLGSGTVMCATTTCAAGDVTPADAVAWQEVR